MYMLVAVLMLICLCIYCCQYDLYRHIESVQSLYRHSIHITLYLTITINGYLTALIECIVPLSPKRVNHYFTRCDIFTVLLTFRLLLCTIVVTLYTLSINALCGCVSNDSTTRHYGIPVLITWLREPERGIYEYYR